MISEADILDWIKNTLTLEGQAILTKSQLVDDTYVKAVNLLLNIEGKVILTGMGKSGHVARKVAATFASTGTPSFFIHPAEAMHGDLGMISKIDVVIAIAFGGETYEVTELVRFSKKIGVPVISITGNKNSSLGLLSTLVLDGSIEKEACPLNLAPTCSTLVSMAIGDALAVALMNARGFEDVDFARYHPQGSLGRKLSLVKDHMIPFSEMLTLTPKDKVPKILEVITNRNLGIAVVSSSAGKISGVISDGDLRRAMIQFEEGIFEKRAESIMTSNPKTIGKDDLALEAYKKMEQLHITSILVCSNENTLLGILRMQDLYSAKVI